MSAQLVQSSWLEATMAASESGSATPSAATPSAAGVKLFAGLRKVRLASTATAAFNEALYQKATQLIEQTFFLLSASAALAFSLACHSFRAFFVGRKSVKTL